MRMVVADRPGQISVLIMNALVVNCQSNSEPKGAPLIVRASRSRTVSNESELDARSRRVRAIVYALFFLSGACGLVYEVVWTRMLISVMGATVLAVSTVLTAFFAGLALGSYLFGKVADRCRRPLRLYALLEAGIGLYALLVPDLFRLLDSVYVALYNSFHTSYYVFSLLRFLMAFLVLLVPTALMGGSFPVISKFAVRKFSEFGLGVGRLYSINTLGAVVGCLLTGFLLIEALGIRGAVFLAAAMNILVGVIAYCLTDRAPADRAPARPGLGNRAIALLVISAGSGFCALAYEVLWARYLVFFLTSSTYAFATMLGTFLLGIALGSAVITTVIDTDRDLCLWLCAIECLIGLFAFLPVRSLDTLLSSFAGLEVLLFTKQTWLSMVATGFLASSGLMLIPTILMGATFPLLTKLFTRELASAGGSIGLVYSVNTLGGIFGSFMTGFVLVPFFGLQRCLVIVACLSVVLGCASGLLSVAANRFQKIGFCLVPIGLAAVVLSVPCTAQLQSTFELRHGSVAKTLEYLEGPAGTAKAYVDTRGYTQLSIDGFVVAGTDPVIMTDQKILAHLPLLLHPDPKKALTVGFGSGGTSWSMLRYPGVEVHCVELVPEMIPLARHFPEANHGFPVFDNPRYKLILNDARNYILATKERYDVIATDCTDLQYSSNANLYSREFFDLCKSKLTDDGLVVAWSPCGLVPRDFKMLVATFHAVFPHTSLWYMNNFPSHYVVLVGTGDKLRIDFARVVKMLGRETIRRDLAEVFLDDPYKLLSTFVFDEETISGYVKGVGLHTEDRPRLEYSCPRNTYFDGIPDNLGDFRCNRSDVEPHVVNLGDTAEETEARRRTLRRYFAATDQIFEGFLCELRAKQDSESYDSSADANSIAKWADEFETRWEKVVREYQKAMAMNPDDKNAAPLLDAPRKALSLVPRARNTAAVAYLKQERPDLAFEQCARILRKWPHNFDAHWNLALAYLKRQRVGKAIEHLERAQALRPHSEDVAKLLTSLRRMR